MENATDALKMAGAVMLFVMALSIIILSFGQVGEASDTILNYRDRETSYESVIYDASATGFSRTVNFETMIPSIYRAFLENYIIVFDGLDAPIYYIEQNSNPIPTPKYTIDLRTQETGNTNLSATNVTVSGIEAKTYLIRAILYGDFAPDFNDKIKNITFNGSQGNARPLYNQLQGKRITEKLGVYYKDDDPNVPEVMREEKRIITYVIE